MRLAAILLPLGLCCCARTYEVVGTPDLPARDGMTRDGVTRDGVTRDGVTRDGVTRDGVTRDGVTRELRLDLGGSDRVSDLVILPLDTTPCNETPTINPGGPCAQQCVTKTGDQDCDGIPDSRDPQPPACNSLVSYEHFSSTSPSSKWVATTLGASFPCGTASLPASSELVLSAAELAKIQGGKYLVEVRYTLGATPPGDWAVRLTLEKPGAPANSITCSQWVNAARATHGGVHMSDQYCGDSAAWSGTVFDTSPGRTFHLQLYSDGVEFACRLASEVGAMDDRSLTCALAAPGALRLSSSRAILVDHIRVFQ